MVGRQVSLGSLHTNETDLRQLKKGDYHAYENNESRPRFARVAKCGTSARCLSHDCGCRRGYFQSRSSHRAECEPARAV